MGVCARSVAGADRRSPPPRCEEVSARPRAQREWTSFSWAHTFERLWFSIMDPFPSYVRKLERDYPLRVAEWEAANPPGAAESAG